MTGLTISDFAYDRIPGADGVELEYVACNNRAPEKCAAGVPASFPECNAGATDCIRCKTAARSRLSRRNARSTFGRSPKQLSADRSHR